MYILNLLTARIIKMTRFHIVHFHIVEFYKFRVNHWCKLKPDGYVSELFDSKRDDLRQNIYTSQLSRSLSARLGETDDWVHSAVWFCRVLDTLASHFSTWSVSFAQQNETQLTSSSHILLWGFASPCHFTTLVVLHVLAHSLKTSHTVDHFLKHAMLLCATVQWAVVPSFLCNMKLYLQFMGVWFFEVVKILNQLLFTYIFRIFSSFCNIHLNQKQLLVICHCFVFCEKQVWLKSECTVSWQADSKDDQRQMLQYRNLERLEQGLVSSSLCQ